MERIPVRTTIILHRREVNVELSDDRRTPRRVGFRSHIFLSEKSHIFTLDRFPQRSNFLVQSRIDFLEKESTNLWLFEVYRGLIRSIALRSPILLMKSCTGSTRIPEIFYLVTEFEWTHAVFLRDSVNNSTCLTGSDINGHRWLRDSDNHSRENWLSWSVVSRMCYMSNSVTQN